MADVGKALGAGASGAALGTSILPGIGTAVGGIAGGLLGLLGGSSDDDRAKQARQKALDAILNIKVPSVADQEVALQRQQLAGQLDPESVEAINAADSLKQNITTDPRLAGSQMKSLATLESLGGTGLSSADREALMQIRNQNEGDAQANQASIMQNMASRGQSGGGQELAARLIAGQQSANRGANDGMSVAAQAQKRALDAIAAAGTLGTSIRSQDFSEQSAKADAQDAINRFNAANRQAVTTGNVGTRNAAQAANLNAKQSVMNANTDIANKEQIGNKALIQQNFDNQMRQGTTVANAENTSAGQSAAQAAQTRGMYGDVGQAVGGIAGNLAAYAAKDPTKPKDDKTMAANPY